MASKKSDSKSQPKKAAAADGWGDDDIDDAFTSGGAAANDDDDTAPAWDDDNDSKKGAKKRSDDGWADDKDEKTNGSKSKAAAPKKAKKAIADDEDGFGDDDGGWGDDEEEEKAEEEEKDEDGPAGPPGLTRSSSYTVMDQIALNARQERLVKQVAEELFVEPTEAGCMLRHFGWKDEKLKKEWWEDPAKVRKDVGLIGTKIETKAPAEVQCESAFCDVVPSSEATRLDCGHWFCNTCWEGFLTSQINDGATCVFASCMGMRCKLAHNHKFGCACNEKVPASFFAKFVKDPVLINKYTRWILNSFVEGQRNVKWCPKPGCDNAVMYPTGGTKDIACKCGHRFCFSCAEVAHSPVPCDLVKNWLQREKSDDATQIWLDARTKQCPKCSVRIEKNKACNHMNCAKCGHHFCWLCKGPWTSHGSSTGGYYVCNKYNEETSGGKMSEEESKILANTRTLQKYTYYYKRFKSSQDAIGITRKLADKIEKSMASEDVAKYGYLNEAADRLIAARHVLQWTYCMAYYFQAGGKKQLFEYQQELLIGNTEALQDTMENSTHEQLLEKRKEIINKTSSIDHFRAEMVKQIERGDFEELLLSSADDTMDNWACSTCKKDNDKGAVHCVACTACRAHGEMDCKPCKDKKAVVAPAKAPAKGVPAKAPAKTPAKAAAAAST